MMQENNIHLKTVNKKFTKWFDIMSHSLAHELKVNKV